MNRNLRIPHQGGEGAKAALQALAPAKKPKIFFLENPNPATLDRLLSEVNLKKTTINVVSKTGTTLETLSHFVILLERMKKVLSAKQLRDRIIVTTEPTPNFLNKWAVKSSWTQLHIPVNVRGRFSVLSPAGLFPMAVAGIPIKKVLQGAQWVDQNRRHAYDYATLAYGAHQILNKPITVLFPYDERLSYFGDWFCQIWGESLAKSEISGPTPMKAIGAIDQHSLLQLFLEGPRNKWYTMIGIDDYQSQLRIPNSNLLKTFLPHLKQTKLADVLKAEQRATERSLRKYKNPLCRLTIPALTPYALGALFHFFKIATATAGYLYHINPFDQPAVDEGKKWAHEFLQN